MATNLKDVIICYVYNGEIIPLKDVENAEFEFMNTQNIGTIRRTLADLPLNAGEKHYIYVYIDKDIDADRNATHPKFPYKKIPQSVK